MTDADYEYHRLEAQRRRWASLRRSWSNYRAWEREALLEVDAEADALGLALGSKERASFRYVTFQAMRRAYNEGVRAQQNAAYEARVSDLKDEPVKVAV